MKEQWKFDKYAKVLSKLEGDRSTPVQLDVSYETYAQPNNNVSDKILIILKILILIACLTLLSWFSIKLYSNYTEFPSLSKYAFQEEAVVSEVIVGKSSIEYYDWMEDVDGNSFTITYGKTYEPTEVDNNNYGAITFIRRDNQQQKFNEDNCNLTKRLTSNLENRDGALKMAITGNFVLVQSLHILEKYGSKLTRDQWMCNLLENETEESCAYILKFLEVTKLHKPNVEESNTKCTDISGIKGNSAEENTSDHSIIADIDANLLLAKYLEKHVGNFSKLLNWYFNNCNSQYYKNNQTDLKVLAVKALFDTHIVNYQENLYRLRTIIDQDREYQKSHEKLLNSTLANDTTSMPFQITIFDRLNVKTAAERLYTYGMINGEILKNILPVVDEIVYITENGVQNNNNTNISTKTTRTITSSVNEK